MTLTVTHRCDSCSDGLYTCLRDLNEVLEEYYGPTLRGGEMLDSHHACRILEDFQSMVCEHLTGKSKYARFYAEQSALQLVEFVHAWQERLGSGSTLFGDWFKGVLVPWLDGEYCDARARSVIEYVIRHGYAQREPTPEPLEDLQTPGCVANLLVAGPGAIVEGA